MARLIIKPRQTGKTFDCIKESAETGAVIVTSNYMNVQHLKMNAKREGFDIPNPISALDIINNNVRLDENIQLIIDDADHVLSTIFNRPIKTISMCSNDINTLENLHLHQD